MKHFIPLLLLLLCLLLVPVLMPAVPVSEPAADAASGSEPATEAPSEPPAPTAPEEPVTILLIGQDRRPGEERARSDAMILCTLKEDRLILTSVLRDLYVRIPGHGSNRINAAYALGGTELVCRTLEENFGILPDGTAEVDFERFAGLIDLLGGVRLELREDERREIEKAVPDCPLEADNPLLTGRQALAYVRIRKLDADGDFSRTGRQRKLLTAVLSSLRSRSPAELLRLAAGALSLVRTDLSVDEIFDLSMRFFSASKEIPTVSTHIPPEGFYASQCIHGMSVLVPDEDRVQAWIQETLQGG